MLFNNLKFAYRNFIRNNTHSLINIVGLTIGFASFIIIALYIQDETSYDKYHKNSNRIYRVIQQGDFDGIVETSTSCPFPLGPTLKKDFPNLICEQVRFFNFQSPRTMVQANEKIYSEKRMFFTDSSVFKVFDVEFIQGHADTSLNSKQKCVITRSTAEKYFERTDVVGELIHIENKLPIMICGVIEDIPRQSHLKYDILVSMKTVEYLYGGKIPENWVWNPCWTYVLLRKGVTPHELEDQIPYFIEKNICKAENKEETNFYLQPLTDIHLRSNLDYEIEANNTIYNLYALGVVAFFLLIIACINFINLATVSSVKREREIGIKKVHGASRFQLIIQFLSETFFFTLLAFFFALIIIEISLPVFNDLFEKELVLTSILSTKYIWSLLALVAGTGLLAGIYPAFYLSSFLPVKSLQRHFRSGMRSGPARKVLVVSQFTIAVLLILGAMIARYQTTFLKNADLGFEKERIIIMETAMSPLTVAYDSIKYELLEHPEVISVTAMDYIIGVDHNTHEFRPEGIENDQWMFFPALVVRHDFCKTFNIKIVAGRDFSSENANDRTNAILVNEAMVKHMGWKSNEDALGRKFHSGYGKERVVGVFRNFRTSSLHNPTGPFVLNMKEDIREIAFFTKYMAVRVDPGSLDKVVKELEIIWSKYDPERPFEYKLLDEELDKLYKKEDIFSELIMIFTLVTLFLAGIGLYGLTSFLTGQRLKEMGIRRILGASTLNIIYILNKDYLKLVLVANILAWPISYLIIENWLDNFAYTVNIKWWLFLISFLFTALLSVIVVTFKGLYATRSNPVNTLKQ